MTVTATVLFSWPHSRTSGKLLVHSCPSFPISRMVRCKIAGCVQNPCFHAHTGPPGLQAECSQDPSLSWVSAFPSSGEGAGQTGHRTQVWQQDLTGPGRPVEPWGSSMGHTAKALWLGREPCRLCPDPTLHGQVGQGGPVYLGSQARWWVDSMLSRPGKAQSSHGPDRWPPRVPTPPCSPLPTAHTGHDRMAWVRGHRPTDRASFTELPWQP